LKERVLMKKRAGIFVCLCILVFLAVLDSAGQDHFIIGTEDGDGFLAYPRHIQEGPDGNIYVFDWSDYYIKVYSPEGKYLRRIGGKGQGPGEVQRADGADFGFTPDGNLYFTEFIRGHRWITFMKLSGEFIKVLPLDIKETFGIEDSYPLEDGGFLIQLSFMGTPEIKKDYFLYKSPDLLARIDSEGKVISNITRTEHFTRISSSGDGGDSPIPYTPVFQWIPYKEETVIFADGMNKKFVVFDYEGNLVREIVTDLSEPDKVTSRDLNAWRTRREELYRDRNPAWWQRFGSVIEKYKKSLYKKPNLSTIDRTFEGNILVSGPARYGEPERDFWLLDDKGKIMAHIRIAGLVEGISENFVFVESVDEEENVLVHCVQRKGSEKEDFLRIRELLNQD
jgi:hypothetical protein